MDRTDDQDRTFLTEFKPAKDKGSQQEQINDLYQKLNSEIGTLNFKIEDALKQHEEDYLKAFRCQMHKICMQLRDLKQKSDENELKLKRDENITSLQKSLNWFKEEAIKLSENAKDFKKDADKWRAKAEALEDDRRFLEHKLKECKKEIQQLKNTSFYNSTPSIHAQASLEKTVEFYPSSGTGVFFLELAAKHPPPSQEFFTKAENYVIEIKQKYDNIILNLKNNIDKKTKQQRDINARRTSIYTEKNQLESLFLECVEEVRKEVLKRRSNALAKQSYKTKRKSSTPCKTEFTPTDKKKIMEMLISNEQVLIMLYEKLFPYRSTQFNPNPREESMMPTEELPSIDALLQQIPTRGSLRNY